jgi:hypothetical protein
MKPTIHQISDFFTRNFGDGRKLYQFFSAQIADDMSHYGIKWSSVERDLTWQAGLRLGLNGSKYLKKGAKTAAIYADIKRVGEVEYPVITLTRRGIADGEYVFNGWQELQALVESEAGMVDLTERQKAKLEKRAEQQARDMATAAAKAEREAMEREASRVRGISEYLALPDLQQGVTPAPYIEDKKLWGILPHCVGIKRGGDSRGDFMAIPLYSIIASQLNNPGDVIGVQKIYDQPFMRSTGEVTNKDFTFGLNKIAMGAYALIGNLWDADVIYAGEGWATCGSAFLAHQQFLTGRLGNAAAIVCLDSGQLKLVVELLIQRWPWLIDKLRILLDNDTHKQAEGKGNAGVMAGLHLCQQFSGVRCQLPDLSEADAVIGATDYSDLHRGHYRGLREVADQISGSKYQFGPFRDPFERELLRLSACPKSSSQYQAKSAAMAGAGHFPVRLTVEQILQKIQQVELASPWLANILDWSEVRRTLHKKLHYRVLRAKLYRGFSRRITDKKHRPDHIQYLPIDSTTITDDVIQAVRQRCGIIIVRAPMASGKTQRLIKPLMWEADRAAYFAHRVSLIGSAHGMLTSVKTGTDEELVPHWQREIFHYHEREAFQIMNVQKMVSCINSINKEAFSGCLGSLDLLAIDEASQTIKSITNGGTMARPLTVYNRLKSVAAKARQVLLLDADANDSLVMWAEQLRELRGDGLPITVIELKTDCSHLSVLHGELNAVYADIVAKVGEGNRCLVATDSADEGERLARALQEQYPNLRGLYVSQDTKTHDEAVERFNNNPDDEIRRYDWLIYSPAISSGVSIHQNHMDLHYGLFRGVVSPSDAVQMLRRDRTARQFILGLGNLRGHRNADEIAYWRATLAGMAMSHEALGISFDEQNGSIIINSQDLDFDQLRIRQVCEENSARNDFSNVLLLQLMADRYQVSPLAMANSEAMAATGEALKKRAGAQLAEEDFQRIMAAVTPSHTEREQLNKQNHLTQAQKASLDRWNIEFFLQQSVSAESVHWLRSGGLSQAKRIELLCMDNHRASALDKAEADSGIPITTRSFLSKSKSLLQDYLLAAGIDPRTGQGVAGQQQLADAMSILCSNAEFLDHYASWCPGLRGRKRPADLFKAVVENLGLVAIKTRLARSQGGEMVWKIWPESWQRMMDVETGRRAMGISSWADVVLKPQSAVTMSQPALVLGVGQSVVTYHPIPAKAVSEHIAALPNGFYTPAGTTWRTGPHSLPIANKQPPVILARGVVKVDLYTPVRIHNLLDDLKARSEVMDPLDLRVVDLIREASQVVGCHVRDVWGLLSADDCSEIRDGLFTLPDLIHYVKACRSSLGALFSAQGGERGVLA